MLFLDATLRLQFIPTRQSSRTFNTIVMYILDILIYLFIYLIFFSHT